MRNEGLETIRKKDQGENNKEVDLEIEDPGAANKVLEEGSLTL